MRVLLTLAAISLSVPAQAVSPSTDVPLVRPRVCLAGNWGKPTREWHVQLGLFTARDSEKRARAMQSSLAKRGIKTSYWLSPGPNGNEYHIVVSASTYTTNAAAAAAAARWRRMGIDAFSRRFLLYR